MRRSRSRSTKIRAKAREMMTPTQPTYPSDANSFGILAAPDDGMPPAGVKEEPEVSVTGSLAESTTTPPGLLLLL